MQVLNVLTGVDVTQVVTFGNTLVVKGSSANALSVGTGGTTNPVLNVVTNVGSQVTGVQITGQTSGSGGLLAAIGSANESLLLQGVGTGIVQTTATTASATVGAFKAINSNASAVGMSIMLSNLSANNTANAAELGFSMNNSTPAEKQFGAIRVTSTTVTAGVEQGTMILRTINAGVMTTGLTLNNTGAIFPSLVDISGASAGQIKFPASQNASANANTLDDYVEGTWTPNVGGNATYTGAQNGLYTKIGRLVIAQFDFTINVIGTGSTTVISGLPVAQTGSVGYGAGSVAFVGSAATNEIAWYCYAIGSNIRFGVSAAAASGITDNSAAIFGNSTRVIGSVTYFAAT